MPITVGRDTSKTRKTLNIDGTEIAFTRYPLQKPPDWVIFQNSQPH